MTREISITTIQKVLSDMPCPNCLKKRLDFLFRCDLGYAQCLHVARCENCRYMLVLNDPFDASVPQEVEN